MNTAEYGGKKVELDENGYMLNQSEWDKNVAIAIAKEEGIEELTDAHWVVIEFMKKVFEERGDAPSIRKLTKESGISTKELYTLFPKGPAKKAARIAGLPKPRGCV